MSRFPIFTVDAFTERPFAGNPAAVCLLPQDSNLPDETLAAIAREMNLSETAFIVPIGQDYFHLRWLTPTVEVNLCGHATLASAHVLFTEVTGDGPFAIKSDRIRFETRSGDLFVSRESSTSDLFTLDFPLASVVPVNLNEELRANIGNSFGIDASAILSASFSKGTGKLVVHVRDTETIGRLCMNLRELEILPTDAQLPITGVIVTTDNTSVSPRYQKYDFISRYFAPWNGIPEDPVTGSAHTVLAAYYKQQLGKNTFYAYQASERGGDMHIIVRDDGRVNLTGRAKTIVEGALRL